MYTSLKTASLSLQQSYKTVGTQTVAIKPFTSLKNASLSLQHSYKTIGTKTVAIKPYYCWGFNKCRRVKVGVMVAFLSNAEEVSVLPYGFMGFGLWGHRR